MAVFCISSNHFGVYIYDRIGSRFAELVVFRISYSVTRIYFNH